MKYFAISTNLTQLFASSPRAIKPSSKKFISFGKNKNSPSSQFAGSFSKEQNKINNVSLYRLSSDIYLLIGTLPIELLVANHYLIQKTTFFFAFGFQF